MVAAGIKLPAILQAGLEVRRHGQPLRRASAGVPQRLN